MSLQIVVTSRLPRDIRGVDMWARGGDTQPRGTVQRWPEGEWKVQDKKGILMMCGRLEEGVVAIGKNLWKVNNIGIVKELLEFESRIISIIGRDENFAISENPRFESGCGCRYYVAVKSEAIPAGLGESFGDYQARGWTNGVFGAGSAGTNEEKYIPGTIKEYMDLLRLRLAITLTKELDRRVGHGSQVLEEFKQAS